MRYCVMAMARMIAETAYTVETRAVKYPRLEFKTGRLVVVLPVGRTDAAVVVARHEHWIREKQSVITRAKRARSRLRLQRRGLATFRALVRQRLERISGSKSGVRRILFRDLRTKWASINARGTLTLNVQMRFLPIWLIDYVLWHEVIHLTERGHTARFVRLMSGYYPDWQRCEHALTTYWFCLRTRIA